MQGSLTGEVLQHNFIKKDSSFYKFLIFFERKIANWFYVITQSDTMINELERLGVPEEKRSNVKDGVDTEVFYPMPFNDRIAKKIHVKKDQPRVLFMGLLEKYQGADPMFSAFGQIVKQHPAVQFVIIGYPNIEKYKNYCRKAGFLKNIRFLGRVPYEDLPNYLSLSNIAVAPKIALTEGDGKIYNYMAMGMATIAFDRRVAREILGNAGIFAKFADVDDLAEKISWVIRYPDQCHLFREKARERAVKYLSWDAVGKRIDKVYHNL